MVQYSGTSNSGVWLLPVDVKGKRGQWFPEPDSRTISCGEWVYGVGHLTRSCGLRRSADSLRRPRPGRARGINIPAHSYSDHPLIQPNWNLKSKKMVWPKDATTNLFPCELHHTASHKSGPPQNRFWQMLEKGTSVLSGSGILWLSPVMSRKA